MRPGLWHPPIELSASEAKVNTRIKRGKLFSFLRAHRHEIFTEAFEQELSSLFKDSSMGQAPVYPAQLALATILQTYTQASDDEVIECLLMDRRWQLVLGCLDCDQGPFGKGTLVRFRAMLIAKDFDRRLLERTIEVAQAHQGFSARSLKAALDSSPLWGAARVEDTYNLLGHALDKTLQVLAQATDQSVEEMANVVDATLVTGSSLKASLDLDWDDPAARGEALGEILDVLERLDAQLAQMTEVAPTATKQAYAQLQVARQIQQQDVEVTAEGDPKLKKGVAKARRITIEDEHMRHGRKSRHKRIDGYKRHSLLDLDLGMVRAVGLTPANEPEATVTEAIEADLAMQSVTLNELHIDRAYLASSLVKQRSEELTIFCKAWPVRNGKRFSKQAFTLDWQHHSIVCPNQVRMPFSPGKVVHFPSQRCQTCPLQEQCTSSQTGRSVSIHPDEQFLESLRQRQKTPEGRAKLRERTPVEHALAHIGHWQGDRARYWGLRKNLFDLRRTAVVYNLHVLARMMSPTRAKTA